MELLQTILLLCILIVGALRLYRDMQPINLTTTFKREDLTTILEKTNTPQRIKPLEREYKPFDYHQTVKKREAADIMRSWGKKPTSKEALAMLEEYDQHDRIG